MLQQRLDLGSEGEQPAVPEVVERLDAQPVARAEQALVRLVPYREGEHAAEAANAFIAILLVGVENGFGVAAAVITMPGALQFGPQIGMIEDFAVVGDPQRAVLVGHRLGAGRQVNDAQAAVAESHAIVFVEAVTVRAAVADDVGHAANRRRAFSAAIRHHRPRDAAHVSKADRSRPARIPVRRLAPAGAAILPAPPVAGAAGRRLYSAR